MRAYKIYKSDLLILLGCILPFFDWSEELISVFDLFYLNIYKITFLFFFIFILKDLKVSKENILNVLIISLFSLVFIIYHNTFGNLKGFLFVYLIFLIGLTYCGYKRLKISSVNVIITLKFLIYFLFIFAVIEILIDKKFITPDFNDNHRYLLGFSVRRAAFTFQDPNYFGFHAGGISILINWLRQKIHYKTTFLAFCIILFTGSRGALLAFLVAQCTYFYDLKINRKFIFKSLKWAFIILIASYLFIDVKLDYSLSDLYLEADKDFKTIVTRMILYSLGLSIILANPLFGIGHGKISTFPKSDYLDFTLPPDVIEIINEMGFHNYPLEFIVENGVLIFILIALIFKKSSKNKAYLFSYILIFSLTSGYESPFLILALLL